MIPTVIALEERAADLLGKEAGLFVTSGTQGNLVAQLAHLARGQETIAASESHIIQDEAAGHAVIVGTSIRPSASEPDGTLDPVEVAEAFRDPLDPHEPITGLVTIENTHAHSMGQPLSVEYTAAIAAVAHERGVPLHVDGARFFNAVVAQGVTARRPRRPGRFGLVLPVEGPRLPGRIGRRRQPRTSSGGHAAGASSWAAACARWASWPRPDWSRWAMGRTARSNAWPRTTPTPAGWPRSWPIWTGSSPLAASPSPSLVAWIRAG